jgi:hypothetical protein
MTNTLTDSQANRRADLARNSRHFVQSRIARGLKADGMDANADGEVKTTANVFQELQSQKQWQGPQSRINDSTSLNRDGSVTVANPRGMKGGEFSRIPGKMLRRRISGGNKYKSAMGEAERQRETDAFFAMADRARHSDFKRPHKTRENYAFGQERAGMDLEQDRLLNPLPKRTVEEDVRLNQRRARMAQRVAAAEGKTAQVPQRDAQDYSDRARAVIQARGAEKSGKIDATDPEVYKAMSDSFAAITRRESNKKRS